MSERARYYILDGHTVVPCNDINVWGRCFGGDGRIVAKTEIGPLYISTVFLGLDHNFSYLIDGAGDHEPLVFETMIFDDGDDSYQTRCSTWEQAEEMHRVAVEIAIARYLPTKEVLTQAIESFGTIAAKPEDKS